MTSAQPPTNTNPFATIGADPEEAQARIQQWAQGFAEKAQRYEAVQQETEELRLSASTPDGAVKVTVRADGSITDLEFGANARTIPLPELSAQILTTMRRAQANIAGRVGEVMANRLGDEDPETRAMMLDNLRERFPDPDAEDEEPEPEQPPEPPAPPAASTPPPTPERRPGPRDDEPPEGEDGENSPW